MQYYTHANAIAMELQLNAFSKSWDTMQKSPGTHQMAIWHIVVFLAALFIAPKCQIAKNWDMELFRLYYECSIVACTLFRSTKPPRPCVPQVTNLFLLFHLVIMPSWRSWWEYNYHSASHRYAIFIVMSSPPQNLSTILFVGFWTILLMKSIYATSSI